MVRRDVDTPMVQHTKDHIETWWHTLPMHFTLRPFKLFVADCELESVTLAAVAEIRTCARLPSPLRRTHGT